MLKCIEEYIEKKITEPKCKEILGTTLNVYILKLEGS